MRPVEAVRLSFLVNSLDRLEPLVDLASAAGDWTRFGGSGAPDRTRFTAAVVFDFTVAFTCVGLIFPGFLMVAMLWTKP